MPTTLIRIDRSSVKRNPDAGRTEWTQPGALSATFTRDGEVWKSVGPVTFTQEDGTVEADFVLSEAHYEVVVGANVQAPRDPVGTQRRIRGTEGMRLQREAHHCRTMFPAPDWLYEYEPTPITCGNCGATFRHTGLEDWDIIDADGDDLTIQRCPKCKERCDIEYEKIDAVVRELKLR